MYSSLYAYDNKKSVWQKSENSSEPLQNKNPQCYSPIAYDSCRIMPDVRYIRRNGDDTKISPKAPNVPVIQKAVYIGDKMIKPNSKAAREFYNSVIIDFLNKNEYASYGMLTQFVNFITVNPNAQYSDEEELVNAFHEYLMQQYRTGKNGKKTPVLRKVSVAGLYRPNWPSELKEKLAAAAKPSEQSQNIRHVIRNYTIKKAYGIFLENGSHEEHEEKVMRLSAAIGITNPEIYYGDRLKEIYNTLYLNQGNLWLGDALINQIIGFLSTPIYQYGTRIVNEEEEFNREALWTLMVTSTNAIRGNSKHKEKYIKELYDIILMFVENQKPEGEYGEGERSRVGMFLQDAGLNFGFDFIDDNSGVNNIYQRQKELLRAEIDLEQYITSKGATGDFVDIARRFMHIGEKCAISQNDNNFMESNNQSNDGVLQEGENSIMQEGKEEIPIDEINAEIQNLPSYYFARPYEEDARKSPGLNSCLIKAIAAQAGIKLSEEKIAFMRLQMAKKNIALLGDLLDFSDDAVLQFIREYLDLDPSKYVIEVYNRNSELLGINSVEPDADVEENQIIPIRILYTGAHFLPYTAPGTVSPDNEAAQNLYRYNNCLIRAIAQAAGISLSDNVIRTIREGLVQSGINPGDELDIGNDTTRLIIMTGMGLNPEDCILKVCIGNKIVTFNNSPEQEEGKKKLYIIYMNHHFQAVRVNGNAAELKNEAEDNVNISFLDSLVSALNIYCEDDSAFNTTELLELLKEENIATMGYRPGEESSETINSILKALGLDELVRLTIYDMSAGDVFVFPSLMTQEDEDRLDITLCYDGEKYYDLSDGIHFEYGMNEEDYEELEQEAEKALDEEEVEEVKEKVEEKEDENEMILNNSSFLLELAGLLNASIDVGMVITFRQYLHDSGKCSIFANLDARNPIIRRSVLLFFGLSPDECCFVFDPPLPSEENQNEEMTDEKNGIILRYDEETDMYHAVDTY